MCSCTSHHSRSSGTEAVSCVCGNYNTKNCVCPKPRRMTKSCLGNQTSKKKNKERKKEKHHANRDIFCFGRLTDLLHAAGREVKQMHTGRVSKKKSKKINTEKHIFVSANLHGPAKFHVLLTHRAYVCDWDWRSIYSSARLLSECKYSSFFFKLNRVPRLFFLWFICVFSCGVNLERHPS